MNTKPILYSFWRSSCSWRARIALALKGIDYEYRSVDYFKDENHSPEYLSVNPAGLVPCLVHGGNSFSESLAIIEYLDEKFPTSRKLLPEKPEDRAKVRALAYMIISNIFPTQTLRVMNYYCGGVRGEKADQWGHHFMDTGFEAFERMLVKTAGKFAFGDNLTMADICIPPQVFIARLYSVDISKFPTIERIDKTLMELPEFQTTHPTKQIDTPATIA